MTGAVDGSANGLARVSFERPLAREPRISAPYVPGKHDPRWWTDAELDVLREYYETKGAAYCKVLLPGRSMTAVYQTARKLQLGPPAVTDRRRPQQRVEFIAELDERIREAWPSLADKGALRRFADELGVKRQRVSKRAQELGLSSLHTQKEPPWSEAELRLIETVPLHSPEHAARIFREHGFARSKTALIVKATRLGLSRRWRDTLSATAAAKILGVDSHWITGRILLGELRAEKRETRRLAQQGGDPWSIDRAELRRYVVEHVAQVDIRRVDKVEFVALLAGTASSPSPSPSLTRGSRGEGRGEGQAEYRAAVDLDPDTGDALFGLWSGDDLVFCVPARKLARFVEKETGEAIDLFAGGGDV